MLSNDDVYSSKSVKGSYCYHLVLNNPLKHISRGITSLPDRVLDEKAVEYKYLIYAFETGALSQTEHIQAYVVLEEPVSFRKMKKMFTAYHVETARKPVLANVRYVRKDGLFFEKGDLHKTLMWEYDLRRTAYLQELYACKGNPDLMEGDTAGEAPVLYVDECPVCGSPLYDEHNHR